MNTFRRNVSLLATCQALMMSGTSLIITTAALVGFALAEDKSWATLPLAAQFIATMFTTIPAALLMERIGRRQGFMLAALFGVSGAVFATLAILKGKFSLFIFGTVQIGIFNGFGNYYRFAAADAVDKDFKGRAVSFIMAGGVIAAFVGPNLANMTREFVENAPFAGSYASLVCLYILSLAVLSLLRLPPKPAAEDIPGQGPGRSLRVIAAQPMFIVALVCGMLGYGVMALAMTATPLAMQHVAHPFSKTSFVIQWHVLGMFAPSFVTGHLIKRYGVLNILLVGAFLGVVCMAVNLAGSSVWHFWTALLFLGISWNFLFIGATTLLTETYRPEERAKAQALNDFAVFTTVALSSLSAGALQSRYGWQVVNVGLIPLLMLILVTVLWGKSRHRSTMIST
ncbi:MAG: MFS transporter [Desulfobulbaceae bacterium]|jgi:MFS family permease|nr:MFS transporter [Desulfobulbaceae bacterium]HKJ15167.1 MFS transporter [Desulfobulbales bacterium]